MAASSRSAGTGDDEKPPFTFEQIVLRFGVGVIIIVLNIVLGSILVGPLGHVGLAIGLSASTGVEALILFFLLRKRIGQRAWHVLHLAGYLSWPLALVHSVGIGTDATTSWGRQVGLGCMAVVGAAALARITADLLAGRRAARRTEAVSA